MMVDVYYIHLNLRGHVQQSKCKLLLLNCLPMSPIFSSIGALEMAMSDGRSVDRLVCRCDLAFSSIQYMQWVFLAQSSLVQTSVDQFSLLQSNIVKSCQIQKNLFQSISGSIQCICWLFIVQSSLDYTSENQFTLLQSKLVKSSQIQMNLFQAIFSDIFGCIRVFISSLWSSLVKSSLFQSNLVKYS